MPALLSVGNLPLPPQAPSAAEPAAWPVKRAAEIAGGDLVVGGLHMVHEREASALTCGPVMPQGGLQVEGLPVNELRICILFRGTQKFNR